MLYDEALKKIKHYCSYQERCHQDVELKMKKMAVQPSYMDDLMAQLIEENYLNEERYAMAYARGKFRMKKWGKMKIRSMLRIKGISDYCINKALDEIEEKDYLQTISNLMHDKLKTITRNNSEKKIKLFNYLYRKGYEKESLLKVLDKKFNT